MTPVVSLLEICSSEIRALVEMAMFIRVFPTAFSVEEKEIQKIKSNAHGWGNAESTVIHSH